MKDIKNNKRMTLVRCKSCFGGILPEVNPRNPNGEPLPVPCPDCQATGNVEVEAVFLNIMSTEQAQIIWALRNGEIKHSHEAIASFACKEYPDLVQSCYGDPTECSTHQMLGYELCQAASRLLGLDSQ